MSDVRKASQVIDPKNLGLLEWSINVKKQLRSKFPKCSDNIPELTTQQQIFKSTKLSNGNVFQGIMKSTSKAGGISHIGYNILKQFVLLKQSGKILVSAITDLANGIANSNLNFLYHW